MTPRACKIAIRQGRLAIKKGNPSVPDYLSDFKKLRLRKAFRIVHLYLRKGRSSPEISRVMGRSNQRVCQILQLGITYMIAKRHIYPVKNEKPDPSQVDLTKRPAVEGGTVSSASRTTRANLTQVSMDRP